MALFDEIYKGQNIDYRENNEGEELMGIEDKEKSKVISLLDTIISIIGNNKFYLGKIYIYISDKNIKLKHKDEVETDELRSGIDKDTIITYLKNIKNMVLDDSININRLKMKIHLNYEIKSSYIGKGRIL